MISTHRPALAYPNRRGYRPLQIFFRRRRKYVVGLSSCLGLLILVLLVCQSTNRRPRGWEPVYHPFTLPPAGEAIADTRIRPIAAQSAVSDECVEQWIAHGIWGACKVDESKIDLVYTWVNGSDPLHHKARTKAQENVDTRRPKEQRFREHDELRFSLRSIRKATSSWKHTAVHIISAEVNPEDPTKPDGRLGLVPQWLNMNFNPPRSEHGPPPIYLHHDSELFRLLPTGPRKPSISEVHAWRNKTLPTFNSHAIESQIPNLNPDLVSENIITLNDDNFMLRDLPPSAYHSTLYGPVLLFQTDQYIVSDATGHLEGLGESRSLGWSNHLLDQRFGARPRPYVLHNARALSLPLLHEASLAFPYYFSATPLSHFRGAVSTPPDLEVNMMFLGSHFVIERHREALLWSWVVAKWGGSSSAASNGNGKANANGLLDATAKDAMWAELGGTAGNDTLRVRWPERTSRMEVTKNLNQAGIREPFADVDAPHTRAQYSFVSSDGSVHPYLPLIRTPAPIRHVPHPTDAVAYQISRAECLGEGAEPAWDVFRRALVENPECGDCFIFALVRATGQRGLDIFLPAPNSPSSFHDASREAETLPLILPATAPPLPPNPRKFALRLIYRYSYSLGISLTKFVMMRSARQTRSKSLQLMRVDQMPQTSLLCMNDDLPEWAVGSVNAGKTVLHEWLQQRWPEKMEWEL
ncbi:hypothetical protein K438DRAFT_1935213 [Mycena galopus ATCC 62051]|nr:hypothetical protein K438DRAFT_1935213 [Mycena galopus ATCC 62051]